MVKYADDIAKRVVKGAIHGDVFLHINNAFTAMDVTKDLSLATAGELEKMVERFVSPVGAEVSVVNYAKSVA